MQTLGLIARGYISGHAPWSDAYESMIYVAWATVGIGLAFGRKSDLTIASTSFVASMILMIAHWNWMDPEIANLVPVFSAIMAVLLLSEKFAFFHLAAMLLVFGGIALFRVIRKIMLSDAVKFAS